MTGAFATLGACLQRARLVYRALRHRFAPITVARFRGPSGEVGRQHGRRFQGAIQAWLADLDRGGALRAFGSWPKGLVLRTAIQAADTGLDAEIEGIADGAGVPAEAIWALNLHPAMLLESALGCTSTAWPGPGGGMLLGKNADLGAAPEPSFILVAETDDALPVVAHRFCGTVWGTAGLNGRGIAFAGSSVNAIPGGDAGGLPAVIIPTLVLRQARTMLEAIDLALKYPVTPAQDGFALLLVDDGGQAAIVERAGLAGAVVGPSRSILTTTNVFSTPGMAARVDAGPPACRLAAEGSAGRAGRLESLRSAPSGSPPTIEAVLADHGEPGDGRGAICRHRWLFLPRQGGYTSFAFVLDPPARILHVNTGPACRGRFRAVPLRGREDPLPAVAARQEGHPG